MAKKPDLTPLAMPDFEQSERNGAVRFVAAVISPLIRLTFGLRVKGAEKLPKEGAFIVVSNHVTKVDALAMAYFLYHRVGRTPHFLAKEGLFRLAGIGPLLIKAGQIPVYRTRAGKNDEPLRAAYECLKHGGVIAIFPEGTLTRDPDLWPMRGRSGAVRLAVEGNVPVFPIAHWGDQEILPRYTSKLRGGFWKKVDLLVGDEIDLKKYRIGRMSTTELTEATEMVMNKITELVEVLRGEKAPAERFDPVANGMQAVGNFVKQDKQAKKKAKR
ncbi:MAG: lysophospholipid acyltransferase family protein [Micrococcales bacterium]